MDKANIYSKLASIQQNLKAPKNQFNKFGGYNYRSCEDILEGLKPLLAENNCVLMIEDEIINKGDRYYIEATATLVDTETAEKITTKAYAREAENKKGMDDSQVTGSTSSYARKYALNGLFCIDDVKDADATQGNGNSKPAPFITKDEARKLFDLAGQDTVKKALESLGYKRTTDIEKAQLQVVIDKINELKEAS